MKAQIGDVVESGFGRGEVVAVTAEWVIHKDSEDHEVALPHDEVWIPAEFEATPPVLDQIWMHVTNAVALLAPEGKSEALEELTAAYEAILRAKKHEMYNWCVSHSDTLRDFAIGATRGTADMIHGQSVHVDYRFLPGPLGGDAGIGSAIANNQVDALFFFIDPQSSHATGAEHGYCGLGTVRTE